MSTTLLPIEVTTEGEETAWVYVEIGTIEIRREPDVFSGVRHGLCAQVKIATEPDAGRDSSTTYSASRLMGETEWSIDATFLANGFPQHVNGFGARGLKVRKFAPEIAATLDREAVGLLLATVVAAGAPLMLPSGN